MLGFGDDNDTSSPAILFTKCSHFFGLNRILGNWIELRLIEITGVFCQSAIDSRVVIEFLIRRSQVRSLPWVPKKSEQAAILLASQFIGLFHLS
jgi:hypothetical protein